jgi:hypothetical protein
VTPRHSAIACFLLAGYLASARMVHNEHYLSDVTFGAAMGVASARTVGRAGKQRAIVVRPAIVPNGMVMLVTVTPNRIASSTERPR